MRIYNQLAPWFHLLTAPADYEVEARCYREILTRVCPRPPRTMLELGSGGGNNASHLKAHYTLTLTDLSAAMLNESQRINPECEHIEGDMRTLRLGRTFDAVFLHDAIMYMVTRDDLKRAIETAAAHCAPGGVVLIAADFTRESFEPGVNEGGHRGGGRSLHYVEHTSDPDPTDTEMLAEFQLTLVDADGTERIERDVHHCGLFPRQTWLDLIADAGLVPAAQKPAYAPGEVQPEVFTGVRVR